MRKKSSEKNWSRNELRKLAGAKVFFGWVGGWMDGCG